MLHGKRVFWAILLILAAAAFGSAGPSSPGEQYLREVHRTTRERFYDRDHDWAMFDAALAEQIDEVAGSDSNEDYYAAANSMLATLNASHCAVVDPFVFKTFFQPEMGRRPGTTARLGIELVGWEDGLFVYNLYEKGPAKRAGIRRGDRVVSVNNIPIRKSDRLHNAGGDPTGEQHYFIEATPDATVTLGIQRSATGVERQIEVTPEDTSMVEATRDSVSLIKQGDHRIGYIHYWHFLSAQSIAITKDALRNEFRQADAIVIDLRGRGGSPWVLRAVFEMFRGEKAMWKKPAVALIDRNSRSAKEVFAWLWRKNNSGPLVGESTPGAVLGSTFMPLSDGSYLILAVSDVSELTNGETLEGVGVKPNTPVIDRVRWMNGTDPILDAGVKAALQEIKSSAAPIDKPLRRGIEF